MSEYVKCDGLWVICQTLKSKLGDGYQKGINHVNIVNMKTGEDCEPLIAYKTSRTDNGIVLNFCPFCGNKINLKYRKTDTTCPTIL